jgi:hypothetical protein
MQVSEPQVDSLGRIDAVRANLVGAAASLVLVGGHLAIVDIVQGWAALGDFSVLVVLGWVAVGAVVHEVLHGVGFRVGGIGWSKIRFGVMWTHLMPYAGCSEPMTVEVYRFAVLLPLWIAGVLPWLVGAALGDHELAVAGAFLTAGAAGDCLVWNKARGLSPGTIVQDLTSDIGFRIVGTERELNG